MDNQLLLEQVLANLAAGKIEPSVALPVLRKLAAAEAPQASAARLLELVIAQGDAAFQPLAGQLRQHRLHQALRAYRLKAAGQPLPDDCRLDLADLPLDVPLGWTTRAAPRQALLAALDMVRDWCFSLAHPEAAPGLGALIERELTAAVRALNGPSSAWSSAPLPAACDEVALALRSAQPELVSQLAALRTPPAVTVDERQALQDLQVRFEASTVRAEKRELLLQLCAWPTDAAAPVLRALCHETWAQETAGLVLALRFGSPPSAASWFGWQLWLDNAVRAGAAPVDAVGDRAAEYVLLRALAERDSVSPELWRFLLEHCRARVATANTDEVVTRWRQHLTPAEVAALLATAPPVIPMYEGPPPPVLGAPLPVTPAAVPEPAAAFGLPPPVMGSVASPRPEPPPPPPPPKPSAWDLHVKPFLIENWYIAVGLCMVLVGASLLAYYTWDKSWLLRCTLMPLLLACITAGLAETGGWLERRAAELAGTATMLRGAAIALLPVNFMGILLLAAGEDVPARGVLASLLTLVYFGLAGWGLQRWCRPVHASLGTLLAWPLLALNALALLRPAAMLALDLSKAQLNELSTGGYYVGFAVLTAAVVAFTRRGPTAELIRDRRISWFFGAMLTITLIEVFAWTHIWLRQLPPLAWYAPMLVLGGGLVLLVERRILELRGVAALSSESFLGFALVFLGLVVGAGSPRLRVINFLLAGMIWLYQAVPRRSLVDYWIGLTLLALTGACVGMLKEFPGAWLPVLAIGLALLAGLLAQLTTAERLKELRRATFDFQVALLFLAAPVTVLARWHYRSAPLGAALCLGVLAMLFMWRALRDAKARYVHVAMVILGMTLPYFGCVDLQNHSLRGNTMCFGLAMLSLLWLAILWLCPRTRPQLTDPSAGNGVAGAIAPDVGGSGGTPDGHALAAGSAAGGAAFAKPGTQSESPNDPAPAGTDSAKRAGAGSAPGGLLRAEPLKAVELLLQARSSVLFVYGLTAVAALVLRVLLEWGSPVDAEWYRHGMDYMGPLLMAAVLLAAAYWSRSLIPAALAAVLVIVLLPELKDELKVTFPWLSLGTGRGSAISALLLTGVCFALRRAAFLRDMAEGDGYFGAGRFPLCRRDHTLFTIPLMTSVLFLQGKVDTWMLLQNLPHVGSATALALILTGVTWTLLAVYFRTTGVAFLCANLGWLWMLPGLYFGHWALSSDPHWQWPALVFGLLAAAFYAVSRWCLEPRWPWARELFTARYDRLLRYGSVLTALVCMFALVTGTPVSEIRELELLVAAVLVWQCLAGGRQCHSSVLFLLFWCNLLSRYAQVDPAVWQGQNFDPIRSLTVTLAYLLGIQAVHLLLDGAQAFHERTQALWRPFMIGATVVAPLAGLWACVAVFDGQPVTDRQLWGVVAVLLLTARAQASPAFLLMAFGVGYLAINGPADVLLLAPWRLSVLGLVLVLAAWLLEQLRPRLAAGPFASPALGGPVYHWLFPPAALAAGVATCLHTGMPEYRAVAAQLPAPFLAALTLVLIGWLGNVAFLFPASVAALTLGNYHLLHHYWGMSLLDGGLSLLHLMGLALVASLAELTALRYVLAARGGPRAVGLINQLCLVLAGLVLALIAVNYVSDPNLAGIPNLRLCISGGMALFAGWYFRSAARRPGVGEQELVETCEAVFHFAVCVFIWCLALLLPVLRHPQVTLLVFWLPGVYFWLRAEFLAARGLPFVSASRNSAATIGFAILALYAFRIAMRLAFYPDAPLGNDYYHYNALYVMGVGLVLLRLRGLGGNGWLAFYGGLALMVGSYFAVTWFPGLSPFTDPVPAAWAAVLVAHFWIAASAQASPLRTALLGLGRLDGEEWLNLRHAWGRILIVAAHLPIAWALLQPDTDTYAMAPLLAGGASVLLHRALVNRAVPYFILAALELLAALHADFVVPSYLPRDVVVWLFLGLWAAGLLVYDLLGRRLVIPRLGTLLTLLGGLVFLHILWHGPGSPTGLWAFAVGAVLAALSPRPERAADCQGAALAAFVPLLAPVWLVFFANPGDGAGDGPFEISLQPCLLALLAAYCVAGAGRLFQVLGAATYQQWPRPQPRVLDHTLTWLVTSGDRLFTASLWTATGLAVGLQVLHYNQAYGTVEIAALCTLYALLLPGWFYEGRVRQTMSAYILLQVCAAFLFAAIRRQLMLTTYFWTHEYDVWASVAVTACLAGAKQSLNLQPLHVRRPFNFSLLLLPAFAVFWVVVNGLGTNLAMIVVGLNSLMYSYLGKDERESPYNVIAVGGFVAFVLLLLGSRFQVRVAFAYIVPAGIGVLFLVQLFARRLEAEVRQFVRGATLLVMFGSVAYSALLDSRHPLAFNLALVGLGLAAMAAGSVLRLRLFLVSGGMGVIVDLISIFAKAVWHMDRSVQMTVVGVLILLVGTALVAGTIYYKTHRDVLSATFARWLRHFGDWE